MKVPGGLLVLITAVHTRIALMTSPENRKYRYFFIRYLILTANLIGVAIVTPIYKNLGPPYLAVTLISSLLLPFILMIFVFREPGKIGLFLQDLFDFFYHLVTESGIFSLSSVRHFEIQTEWI